MKTTLALASIALLGAQAVRIQPPTEDKTPIEEPIKQLEDITEAVKEVEPAGDISAGNKADETTNLAQASDEMLIVETIEPGFVETVLEPVIVEDIIDPPLFFDPVIIDEILEPVIVDEVIDLNQPADIDLEIVEIIPEDTFHILAQTEDAVVLKYTEPMLVTADF